MLSIVLTPDGSAVNKIDKLLCFLGTYILVS